MGLPVMLKLLTDENVFPSTVEILRSHHFDVTDIKELGLIGIGDREIMDLAKSEGRNCSLAGSAFRQHFSFPPQ